MSSLETRPWYQIEPLRFTGDPDAAWRRLVALLEAWPRTRIVAPGSGQPAARLEVVFRTPILRFPDDATFVLDRAAGVIQVRSAARYGRRDFGVNRERIEAIRHRFATAEERA